MRGGPQQSAHLPMPLAVGGEPRSSYEMGNVAYWSPGPDIAIFHDHDGESIPAPIIIVLGEFDSGLTPCRSTTARSTSPSGQSTETRPVTADMVNEGGEGGRSQPHRLRRRPG
ncbi:cyclophilin-like fold protein [Streptomyces sp. SAS_260]|uniref:cyclophilin-like fold protein n=1 Tax=Streptomyces sp. SAS_260 TaxID=3412751 RepID=UPI00403C51A5